MLAQLATDLFGDHTAPESATSIEDHARLIWRHMEAAGLTGIGVAEELGGSGGSIIEAAEVIIAAGRAAAPVPVADAVFTAGWLTGQLEHPLGIGITLAWSSRDVAAHRAGDRIVLRGRLRHVPWARLASQLLLVLPEEGIVVVLPRTAARVEHGLSIAEEPSDTLHLDDVELPASSVIPVAAAPALARELRHRIALSRALLLAGALQTVTELTISYVKEREQFGRPIARFQAVGQSVAILAGHSTLATAAARAAVRDPENPTAVLSARVATAAAASRGAMLAHQLHGAIGFTREHRLHELTRRLWAWRDEVGTEGEWRQELGLHTISQAGSVWETLTG